MDTQKGVLTQMETLAVIDLGGKDTQLITRTIRDMGVYSEQYSYKVTAEELHHSNLKGIVLVGEEGEKDIDSSLFTLGIPVLGIGSGLEMLSKHIFKEQPTDYAHEEGLFPLDAAKHLYGLVAFPTHVEEKEPAFLRHFLTDVCAFSSNWNPKTFVEYQLEAIRHQVGDKKVILALSGGVDSSVTGVLLERAIGDQLTSVFVDHGLLRKGEREQVMESLSGRFGLNVIMVDAKERFLSKLAGVSDPETKRKIIGNEFIEVFAEEAEKLDGIEFLAQGTIYPDIIESGTDTTETVKSHHNVGGLPEDLQFELIEPLKALFKDEVRAVGEELGIPSALVWRQPFPGPGLGVRVLGEITEEKLHLVRETDAILRDEIAKAGLERDIWQYFTALPGIRSVGVTDGIRSYDYTIGIRAVHSIDAMTADFAKIPWDVLQKISKRMTDEVDHINRVVYDITSKPPASIEWE